jgi:hypothetical protein
VKTTPIPGSVRVALVSLYGAVAAIVRADWPALHLMVSELSEALEDVEDTLVVISLASLECLWACGADAGSSAPNGAAENSGVAAREVLAIAATCGLSTPELINAAAWRLDAIRDGDKDRAAEDIARSRRLGTDRELIDGALALLAAIVTRQARRSGRSPRVFASEICVAAALATS